jgi:hypothetical protein
MYESDAKAALNNLGRPMEASWLVLFLNLLRFSKPKS